MTGTIEGAFGHDYTELAQALLSRKTRYVYIPNPGNAGDSLIAANADHFFRAIGLDVETGFFDHTYPDRDVIYAGGGNLIPAYQQARGFIERHKDIVRSLTLLPHTVRGHENLLATLDDRFTLFAREKPTLDYLQTAAPGAKVAFGHDMAFFAEPRRLTHPMPIGLLRTTRSPGALRHNLRQLRRWQQAVAERRRTAGRAPEDGRGTLNAFRTDVERPDMPLPDDNIDLSAYFEIFGHQGPFLADQIVRALVRAIEPYDKVRTNRLHIAILSALLGKTVEVGDNSYGKLGDVYRASMTRFDKLRFL